ncbi:MAG: ARC6/PARC6 family protein [Thermoanaerobaculia bacterium]|nr:ARC6/PARC6 family protein [Thermoanaerobaculia bacterium]
MPFQTGDSGLYYFFDADNWEMLVKVLDACGFNDHFWVFSAATTNVEYTLTVTDTFTGKKKRYFNSLGTAAPAITDTSAFATCGARGSASAVFAPASASFPSPAEQGLRRRRESTPATEKTECVPSGTTMCLEGGRFALEIDWRNFMDETGPGLVVQGTPSDDSGLFQFFGENNWEVLVKVLDACTFNGRFWLFSAAPGAKLSSMPSRLMNHMPPSVRSHPGPLKLVLGLAFWALAVGLAGCSPPGAEEIDKSEVRTLLEAYLPKLGEAYAQADPSVLEPWAVPKEVARIELRIGELEANGQVYEPVFQSLEVVSISPWNYSNAFVTTIEIWDVSAYTMGSRRLVNQALGQKSRVKYQLKRRDDSWVVLYRELEQTLES